MRVGAGGRLRGGRHGRGTASLAVLLCADSGERRERGHVSIGVGVRLVAADHAALLRVPEPGGSGLVGGLARHAGRLLGGGSGIAGALGLALGRGGRLCEPAPRLLDGTGLLSCA